MGSRPTSYLKSACTGAQQSQARWVQSERGAKSEVAHLWAKWLHLSCRLGDPHRDRAGGKISSGPLVGKVAMLPLPSQGSPPLQSGGQTQKWPTCGQRPQPSRGSPPLQSGGQNHKWPTCGQSGCVTPAVSGIPTAAERGQTQKWTTCRQSGYVTSAVSGIPTTSERGPKSEVVPKRGRNSVTRAFSAIPKKGG